MGASPAITVLLPVYNAEKYLRYAIQSILEQTFEDFELLIIDDGSVDQTEFILSALNDKRVRIIRQENQGLSRTLNRGIGLSRGLYIARMDPDDIALPNRLSTQHAFLENHPSVGVCGSWVKAFRGCEEQLWKYPESYSEIRCRLLFSSMLAHPSVMFRKAMLEKYNLQYSPEHVHAEDYELWVRCMDLFALANLPEPLLLYRLHQYNTGVLFTKAQKQTVMKIQSNILKRLGVDADLSELELHYHLGRGSLQIELSTLGKVDSWLTTLAQANQASGYFPKSEFAGTLGLYWLNVCRSMVSLGPAVARRFSKSTHIRGFSSPLLERLKLEFRTRKFHGIQ